VERTFAWLGSLRRVLVPQECYIWAFRAFFLIAFILVLLRQSRSSSVDTTSAYAFLLDPTTCP
jgi:hypothetical protein